jgi:hypothetical protein
MVKGSQMSNCRDSCGARRGLALPILLILFHESRHKLDNLLLLSPRQPGNVFEDLADLAGWPASSFPDNLTVANKNIVNADAKCLGHLGDHV